MFSQRVLWSAAVFALAHFLVQPTLGAASGVAGYPSKPIRFVVPFTAGSATDILARLIGSEINKNWGQQIVVDNRPSGGGTIAGSIVASAAPDGYTILMSSSAFAASAALYDNLPYDALKDFHGVTQVASSSMVLVVAPSLGVKTAQELIALAQQKPRQLSFSSAGIGSGTHYGGERFNLAAKIQAVHVPYKGTPESLNDIIAGRVQYSVASIVPAVPLIKSGRLTALAVSTSYRAAALPDVPTVAEIGVPDAECDGWYGVFVQRRTPPAITTALSREIGRVLGLPDIQEKIVAQGGQAKPSTPEAFDAYVRSEILTRRKVFSAAGVKVN